MADDTRVYTISFRTGSAVKNLKELEEILKKIEKSDIVKKMGRLDAALKRVERSAKSASGTIKKELGKTAKKSLDDMSRSAKGANKELGKMPKTAKRAAVSMRDLGRNLRRYVLLPLGAISIASIKSAFDINKSMANVSTLLDAPIEKVKELKTQVQSLAVESGKGTKDLADGLYQVVSALGESSDNMAQLGVATKASVAGVSGTTEAVSMLTAVGKAYNDTSSEAIQKTSDLAFQTVKLGVTTFPELASSIGKVAPLAAQFGTSQEELFGTMATLTGVTGSTAEVTTQLASVYSAFMKPSDAMNDSLKQINKQKKEYNFKTIASMVKTLGFKKSVELLGETAGGSEKKLLDMFRRKEAILGILPLISSQSENYTKKVAAMGDAAGATDAAYEKQTEGINKQGHSFEKTKQRMIVFAQRLGDRLLPVLERLMDVAEPVLEWLENMDEKSIDTAISIGKAVVQFVLLLNAVRGLNAIVGGVTSFFSAITGQMGAYGSAVDGATTKTNKLTKSMANMQKGVAVLGALALGYSIGDLIDKALIAPHRQAQQQKRDRFGNLATETFSGASKLTDTQLMMREQALKEGKEEASFSKRHSLYWTGADEDEYQRSQKAADESLQRIKQERSFRNTGIQAGAAPTGDFSSQDDFIQLGAVGARQNIQTDTTAFDAAAKRDRLDAAKAELQSGLGVIGNGGASGGGSVVINNNMTVNATSDKAPDIEKAMKRGAKSVQQEQINALNRVSVAYANAGMR